jgi:hypothetical protein
VYLAYSDESGSGDVSKEPILVVAAVLINPDSQWDGLEKELNNLVNENVPENRRDSFEFHAKELFARLERKDSKALLKGMFTTLQKHRLPVYYGAVHRQEMGRTSPELSGKALLTLAQAAAFIQCAFQVENAIHSIRPNEKLLWIADNTNLAGSMKMLHHHTQTKTIRWPDLPWANLDHIMDTIYFGHSNESRGLQLADACNFVIRSHLIGKKQVEPYYELLRTQIAVSPVAFAPEA